MKKAGNVCRFNDGKWYVDVTDKSMYPIWQDHLVWVPVEEVMDSAIVDILANAKDIDTDTVYWVGVDGLDKEDAQSYDEYERWMYNRCLNYGPDGMIGY